MRAAVTRTGSNTAVSAMGSRDTRRVLGPDKSISHILLQPQEPQPFLRGDGRRWDGRWAQDPRKLFMSVGMITQAKGSSYVEVGNTKVCCGVYGPKDVQRGQDFKMSGQVLCVVKMAPFSTPTRLPPQPDTRQQEMSRQLKDTLEAVIVLEKFPKSQIDIYVTVIEDDGALLGACVTAAGLALCHANIDVYDVVVGATVLWYNDQLYVDPTRGEENYKEIGEGAGGKEGKTEGTEGRGCSQLIVGMMPKHAGGQVGLLVQGGGQASTTTLTDGLETAVELCNRLHALAKKTLLDHLEETLGEEETSTS